MNQRDVTEARARRAFQWEKGLDKPDTSTDLHLQELVLRENYSKELITATLLYARGRKLAAPVGQKQCRFVTF